MEAHTYSPVVCSCIGTWSCRLSLWSPCWRPVRTQTGRGVCPAPSWSASVDPKPENCPAGSARPAPPGFPQTLQRRRTETEYQQSCSKSEHTVSHKMEGETRLTYGMPYRMVSKYFNEFHLKHTTGTLICSESWQLEQCGWHLTLQHGEMHSIIRSLGNTEHHLQTIFNLSFTLLTTGQ